MKKITSIIAGLGISAIATLATVASAAPETYVIDGTHTYPRFDYSHLGFSTQSHRFEKTSGKIVLDRAEKKGSVDVVIEVGSVKTGSTLDSHIQGEDFLFAEKFPSITFKSSNLKFAGEKLASVTGDLTIRGVTKPVTLEITHFNCMQHPMRKKDACGANAVAKIKRSDFGITKYMPAISDEIALTIAVEAVKE